MQKGRISLNQINHDARGFTLFEVFLAILILAIAIVPMLDAFAPAFLATAQGEGQAVLTGRARGTMNRVLDLDFRNLNANQGNPVNLAALFGSQAEADQENLVYQGTTYTPVVAITDASGGAGGLLEITVTLHWVRLRTLKSNR